jgi:hypothetical protein
MPINNLPDNQMVSEAAAAASGNLTLKDEQQTNVISNQCMTKSAAMTRYRLDSFSMSPYAQNQLPPSIAWVPVSCSFSVDFVDQANQPAPVCPGRVVVFQICNSNAAKDDNFDIYLNGVYIGGVDLSSDTRVGSVFIGSTNSNLVITEPDFICSLTASTINTGPPSNTIITNPDPNAPPDMTVYRFSPSLLRAYNSVEMRNTQNNNNGNFGVLGFRNYLQTGNNLTDPVFLAGLTYSPPNGGDAFFNFEWLSCT